MLFAGDLAGVGVRAAFGFGWADLADVFQSAIARRALAGWTSAWVRVVPSELLQYFALRSDVLVVRGIPFEVGARPGSVIAPRLVEDRNVRRDLAVH